MATPTLGRIVLYRSDTNDVCPAIITKVISPFIVNLTIFPDDALPVSRRQVTLDDGFKTRLSPGGAWSWNVIVP